MEAVQIRNETEDEDYGQSEGEGSVEMDAGGGHGVGGIEIRRAAPIYGYREAEQQLKSMECRLRPERSFLCVGFCTSSISFPDQVVTVHDPQ